MISLATLNRQPVPSVPLPQLAPGVTVHALSAGTYSLHDVIAWALDYTGPAHLRLASWTVSEEPVSALLRLRDAGQLLSVRALLHWRAHIYEPSSVAMLTVALGRERVRCTETHAKLALLQGTKRCVTVLGSQNLTQNPRLEQVHVVEGRDVHDAHAAWFDTAGRAVGASWTAGKKKGGAK